MAIPVIESTALTNTGTSENTDEILVPSGVEADDIIIIISAFDGNAANPTSTDFATLTSTSEGAVEVYALWKRATGADSGNYTINWTGNERARHLVLRISGCIKTGDPWDDIADTKTGTDSQAQFALGQNITSTEVNTLGIAMLAVDRDVVDSGDGVTAGTGWATLGTSGSTSGGANAVGLVTAEVDIATVSTVSSLTLGAWSVEQIAGRQFNLKEDTGVVPRTEHWQGPIPQPLF